MKIYLIECDEKSTWRTISASVYVKKSDNHKQRITRHLWFSAKMMTQFYDLFR